MKVTVPDIGDFDSVEVVEVLVAAGDDVEVEQSLITLESDKASLEVPSPAAGKVLSVTVTVGAQVAEGDLIAELAVEAAGAQDDAEATAEATTIATAPESPPAPTEPAEAPAGDAPSVVAPRQAAGGPPYASPSVRKLARELGVDLAGVRGSGRKGRLVHDDVRRAASAPPQQPGPQTALPEMPTIDFSQFGPVELEALTKINRLTGQNLHRSWLHVPHVTQFDEADITELEAFRRASKARAEAAGARLTFVSFLLAGAAAALREFPRFNASLDAAGENLILKRYIHIGVAVDTPRGLVVPVIRDVGSKRIFELARELGEVSARARDGKLTMADIQGGSFTISSLGGIGGTAFTPIVNAPEVAILGVSRAKMQPQWNGDEFIPRLMLPLSLSYDHRVIDGAAAARFTSYLSDVLSDIRNLIL
jgi:pyruvate dehydrogenase E2 component (dihydrolipoamide acetyltransferase)